MAFHYLSFISIINQSIHTLIKPSQIGFQKYTCEAMTAIQIIYTILCHLELLKIRTKAITAPIAQIIGRNKKLKRRKWVISSQTCHRADGVKRLIVGTKYSTYKNNSIFHTNKAVKIRCHLPSDKKILINNTNCYLIEKQQIDADISNTQNYTKQR